MEKNSETWQAHAKSIWKAQIFIQDNLDKDLTLNQVAKAAGFSPYHFHRIFRAFTGESLNHFIRRLRIEKAAGRLKHTRHMVTDIALDSGYQTPSSFSRAFAKVMGTPPQRYRSNGRYKYDGHQTKQSNKEKMMIMKPEIINFTDHPVLFVRRVGPYEKSCEEAWEAIMSFAKEHNLNLSESRKFSDGLDDPAITEKEKLRFDACISAPKEIIEKGDVGRKILEGGKYAVFLHKGPYEKLEETFDAIFQEWFPHHKDEVADRNGFCEHLNPEIEEKDPSQLLTNIYIPLK